MAIDVSTLILYSVTLLVIITGLLVVFWLREGRPAKFLWFALPFVMGSCGGLLLITPAPAFLPEPWTLQLGACFILLGYGFGWQAARAMYDRPARILFIVLPPLLWLVLSAIVFVPLVLYPAGAGVRAFIVALFNGLAAWEFWRSRKENLPSRTALFWLFAVFAVLAGMRITMTAVIPIPTSSVPAEAWTVVFYNIAAITQALLVCAFMIALIRERAALQNYRMALIDPLTGLGNRRAFEDYAAGLRAKPGRIGQQGALMLVDIDLFKQINDQFGHPIGDQVLITAARTAEKSLRQRDRIFRFGGDEFICVLPGASLEQALVVAECLRSAFQFGANTVADKAVKASVSIGVAAGSSAINSERLVHEADAALYKAKRAGRNRILSAGAEPVDQALAEPKPGRQNLS